MAGGMTNRAVAVHVGAILAATLLGGAEAPPVTEPDPETLSALRDLVKATRARSPFEVKTSLVVEVSEGEHVSRSPSIEGTLRFDPRAPRAALSLRGFEILVRDGRIDVHHASNEREYVSLDDEGAPRETLLAEFLDLPYPHLGIVFGGDDADAIASRLVPRVGPLVPSRVETVELDREEEGTARAEADADDAGGATTATRSGVRRRLHFTGEARSLQLDVDPATNAITGMRLEVTGGPLVRDGAVLRMTMTCDDAPLSETALADAFTFDPGERRRIDSIAALPRATEGAAPGIAGAGGPTVGRPAPDFALPGIDGAVFDLAAVRGTTVVIVDFWATWCAPCRVGLPKLDAVVRRLQERGVPITAVAVNTFEGAAGDELVEKVSTFWRDKAFAMTSVLDEDGATAAAYGVRALPTTVVVGLDGKVHWRHEGLNASWETDLEAAVEAALKPADGDADLQPIRERP